MVGVEVITHHNSYRFDQLAKFVKLKPEDESALKELLKAEGMLDESEKPAEEPKPIEDTGDKGAFYRYVHVCIVVDCR